MPTCLLACLQEVAVFGEDPVGETVGRQRNELDDLFNQFNRIFCCAKVS